MENTDYIIVGSGLAGITLAHTLRKKNLRFKIISKPELSSCSYVAAGIYNPVVFYRITKSYMADVVLPFSIDFYTYIEEILNVKLLDPHPLAKIFSGENEKNLWEKRKEEGVGIYLEDDCLDADASGKVNAPVGFGIVKHTGSMDCEKYLSASLTYFNDEWIEEKFDYSKLHIGENEIEYNDLRAHKIIFCEGHLVSQNPYFNAVKLKPVKGETITIQFNEKLPEHVQDFILTKKCFLLPVGNSVYKVGATYNWNQLNDEISEEGLLELTNHIKDITSIGFKLLNHVAGVRPASSDRRPILGVHPEFHPLYIYNGLGTKGVMLAPYYAEMLSEFITGKIKLHKEINLTRFKVN